MCLIERKYMDFINAHSLLNYWRGLYKILEEDWQHSAQKLGLTPAEEHLIWIIHFEKEITISEIAKIGLWDLSTAMQIVNRAKGKGLINVSKKNGDRRISYVSLTQKGEDLHSQSKSGEKKRIIQFLDNLSEESKENRKILQDLANIQKQIAENFYGKDFVEWVERTKKM